MKLSIFQSDKGDCFLLESSDGKLVLCDGGMGPSMRNHVRGELGKLGKKGRELELVYVSHVDNDHISGVLVLLEDESLWRVYDYKKKNGDAAKLPNVPRPPKIKGILHNGFRDQLSENNKSIESLSNTVEIEGLLASMAPSLFATNQPELARVAEEMQAIATGIPESLQVTQLVDSKALDIPLNKPPGVAKGGKLLRVGRPGETFTIGTMKFTLIGPTTNELKKLRDGWQNWLRKSESKERVKKIRAEIKRRVDAFSTGALSSSPFDLGGWEGIPDHKHVTVPNIASIMFMVEEGGKRLLLTGDAQQDFILAGLETQGFVGPGAALHVDVLKVQHHGSEHNLDAAFARRVSADHYVFGANGEHNNPDLRVIDFIYSSRLGPAAARNKAAPNRRFNFWFSTTSAVLKPGSKHQKYFKSLEDRVQTLVAKSNGKLKVHYNKKSSLLLSV
jgi:hypothetical protein